MTEPRPRLGSWAIVVLLGAGLVIGGGLTVLLVELFDDVDRPINTVTTSVVPTVNVITAIRDLSRLETASYQVERVIDMTDQQEMLFGLVEAEDAILLVAAGEVTAGVDLSRIREGDVRVSQPSDEAWIILPPAEVFTARLDNTRTYVHGRQTDTLAKRSETLETRARQRAEQSMRDAALEGGILERANRSAERTVRSLVQALGYRSVHIERRPP